jgi:hypothetical protein
MYYAVEVYKIQITNGNIEDIWSKVAIVPGPFSADPSEIYRVIAPDDMTEEQAEALAIKRAQEFGRMSYRVTVTTLHDTKYKVLDQLRILRPSLSPPLDHTLMITNISHDISDQGKFTILEARFFDLDLVGGDPASEFENVANGSAWEPGAGQKYFGTQFSPLGTIKGVTGLRIRYTVAAQQYTAYLRDASGLTTLASVSFTGTGAAMDVEFPQGEFLNPARTYEVGYGSATSSAMRYAIAGFEPDTEHFNFKLSYSSTAADGATARTEDNTKRPAIGIFYTEVDGEL